MPSTQKSRSPAQTIVVQKPDTSALNNLQNQVQQLRKQYNDLANQEQAARRRLEANQEAISKKMGANADNAISARSMDDLRRQLGNIENKLTMMGQDFGLIKGTVDRHTADIMGINSDVKNRPVVDPTVKKIKIKAI
jgi:chromosome segregation ATPase